MFFHIILLCYIFLYSMIAFLDLSYLNKSQFKETSVKMKFHMIANMESNEVHYPPFGCPLRCVEASKPAAGNMKQPFLVYHILKANDTNKDLYQAIHPENRLRASGVVLMNFQDSLWLDKRFFKDRNEAKSFQLPLIVVAFRPFFEFDLLGNKKPDITLFLKVASEL